MARGNDQRGVVIAFEGIEENRFLAVMRRCGQDTTPVAKEVLAEAADLHVTGRRRREGRLHVAGGLDWLIEQGFQTSGRVGVGGKDDIKPTDQTLEGSAELLPAFGRRIRHASVH